MSKSSTEHTNAPTSNEHDSATSTDANSNNAKSNSVQAVSNASKDNKEVPLKNESKISEEAPSQGEPLSSENVLPKEEPSLNEEAPSKGDRFRTMVGRAVSSSRSTVRRSLEASRDTAGSHTSDADNWSDYVAHNRHTLIYGVGGAIVAVAILIFGFWPIFLIVLCATIGITYGQWLDGNPRIIDALMRLFR